MTNVGAHSNRWPAVPFADAIEDITGGNPKVPQSTYQAAGKLRVIDQGQSAVAGYVDDESLQFRGPLPCILFGDHTKIFKYAEEPFALGADGVKALQAKDGFDPRFLYHYFQTVRLPKDAGYSRHFKFLKEALVPRPPFEEQRRIATILDKAVAIRRKRQQSIKLVNDFLCSVFLDMFGREAKLPRSELGDPAVSQSIEYGLTASATRLGAGPKFLRITDIQDGGVNWESVPLCKCSASDEDKYRLKPGDILFARTGATTGKSFLIRECPPRAVFASYLIRVRPGDAVNADYLAQFFKTQDYWSQVAQLSQGAAQPGINGSKLKVMTMPIPPKETQAKFSEMGGRVERLMASARVSETLAETLLSSLTQRLFGFTAPVEAYGSK